MKHALYIVFAAALFLAWFALIGPPGMLMVVQSE